MCFLHITHNRLQKRNRLLVKLRKKSTHIKYRLPVACYTFLIFIIIINFIHKFSINLQNIIKAVEWVSCLNLLRASYKRYINQFIATWDECKLECGWMWIRARIFWWTMSFCTLKNKTLSKVKKITIIQHDVYKIIKLKKQCYFCWLWWIYAFILQGKNRSCMTIRKHFSSVTKSSPVFNNNASRKLF